MTARRGLTLLAAGAALAALPAAAAADTTWTRVTDAVGQPVIGQPLAVAYDGTTVTGVWTTVRSGRHNVELVRFVPSRAADAAQLVRLAPPTLAGWDNIEATPLPVAGGGLQLLVAGTFGTSSAAPTGTSFAPLDAAGNVGPLVPAHPDIPDSLSALLLPAGPLWAVNASSTIRLYRAGVADDVPITGGAADPVPLPGRSGYIPRLGRDAQGRLWLAVYAFGGVTPAGIHLLELDPTSGLPIGPPQLAPRSATIDNNGRRLALACAATCRIVYEETRTDVELPSGRLLSWAPGEGEPTVVAGVNGLERGPVAAAYRADGRLWVGWAENVLGEPPVYRAKLGDARGAGGGVVDAGRPPLVPGQFGSARGLEAVAVGDDLLLDANWQAGDALVSAQWVNIVLPAGVVDTSGVPNPRVVTSPGGKLVFPRRVDAGDLGPGRCVRVKPVADKPARIWAQVFSGRRDGKPVSNRVAFRFAAAGTKSSCVTLQRKPAGFYRGKVFRIRFEVRTGATAKPIERTRPPWRTQPPLVIDA